jgi:hypothetical protein
MQGAVHLLFPGALGRYPPGLEPLTRDAFRPNRQMSIAAEPEYHLQHSARGVRELASEINQVM